MEIKNGVKEMMGKVLLGKNASFKKINFSYTNGLTTPKQSRKIQPEAPFSQILLVRSSGGQSNSIKTVKEVKRLPAFVTQFVKDKGEA